MVKGSLYEFVFLVNFRKLLSIEGVALALSVPLNMYLTAVMEQGHGVYGQGVSFGWLCSVLLFVFCLFCTYAQRMSRWELFRK